MRIILIGLIVVFLYQACLLADESVGGWEKLSFSPSEQQRVSAIGMESGGILWLIINNSICYWEGKQLRTAKSELTSGRYLKMLGGLDRGLYVAQAGREEYKGKLYRLTDGQVVYVTDFYHEARRESPGLYISKSGRLFNWGSRFLAVYFQDQWKRIEAPLSLWNTLIFDTGEKVYFYYNQNLYSVDNNGNFDNCKIDAPIKSIFGQKRIHGALWGRDKMVILDYGSKRIYAYDLNTAKSIDAKNINSYLGKRHVYDIFRAADGSVWVLVSDLEFQGYFFLKVTPQGDITPVKETFQLGWDNTRCWQFPNSVLNASDGSIWFATPRLGMARYKDGKVQVYGWKQGVSFGNCRFLLEGLKGDIYALSSKGVYTFCQGATSQLPTWGEQWDEYRIASSHPIRDSNGNIWMCLDNHPGKISCWDGNVWKHIKVPFNTSKVSRLMADDQGHILLTMNAYPDGCYDIGLNGIQKYENTKAMLVKAVARGVKRFYTDGSFQGCVVQEGGKIWFGYHNYNQVHYFDGNRWDSFRLRGDIDYLYESPKYDILFRTQGGKYYTYDRGQIIDLEISNTQPSRWLLGPKFLQPFEQELLKMRPNEYIPVERAEDGKLYLLSPTGNKPDSSSSGEDYIRGDCLNRYLKTLTPGFCGGHWSDYISGPIFRFFGNKIYQCNFVNTPVLGKEYETRQVLEDCAHNLWIDAGWYSGARHVFIKRLNDFELQKKEIPTQAKSSVTIAVKALLNGLTQPDTRIFWRFKGQQWHEGESENSLTIRFPGDGRYEIEIVAMGPLGGITPEPLSFTILAKVPPHTMLTQDGQYICKDVIWEIPAKPEPSESSESPYLKYRLNEGPWKNAYKDNMVIFDGLEAGKYHVEVKAREGQQYDNTTHLSFNVKYEPDYNYIVESRIDVILGHDSQRTKAALSEIKMVGPDIVPVLRNKLIESLKTEKLIHFLEHLLQELDGIKEID
jgi:hypothetical protein